MPVLLLLAGLLTVAPVAARAQDVAPEGPEQFVEVDRRGPGLVEAVPGEAVTIPFMVTSSAPDTLDLVFRAHLPDGWRLHGGDQPHRLGPGDTHLRLLSISADASATARTSAVRLDVGFAPAAERGPSRMLVSDSVHLHLPPHPSISLTRLATRDVAVAGQQYGASVTVVNSGNVPLDLDFTAKSSGGYRTTVAPARVRLAPSARQQLNVHVWSTRGIERARREVLRIEARSPDLPGTGREEIAIGLDLLPGADDAWGDRYHRLPVHVRLSASPGAGAVPPFRVSGSGALFDDGTARLDFLAQGPAVARSLTGATDEYSVRYRSDRLDLQLGDHAFAATPLTDYAIRATGVGASVSVGALRFGGHHAFDRRSAARGSTSAASLGVAAGPLDLEARWQDRTGAADGSLMGGRGRLRLHRGLSLDGEFVGAAGRPATGHRLDASGQLPAVSYRITYRDTDPNLPVRGAGGRHQAAHLQLRPLSWLRLFGGIEQMDQRGRSLSDDLTGAETSSQRKAGLGLGGRFTLEMTERRRLSTFGERGRDRASRTLSARGSLRGASWSVRPRLEVGQGTGPASEGGLAYGGALETTIRTGDRFSLSGAVEHHFGADIDPVYDARRSRVRVALSSALTASTRMNVSWAENRRPHPLQGSSRMVEVMIKHRLPFGHEVEARVRSTPPRNTPLSASLDDPMAHLSYGMPLSVPISRSSAAGQLRLRLIDEVTNAPVAGVRVTVGGTFGISDRKGEIRLGGLSPGDHEVRVERGTAGVARIAADAEALQVTIRAGREAAREIRLVTGTSLSGSVRLFRFEREPRPGEAEPPALVDAGAVPGATVEVSRGEQVYRVATDSEGGYTFLGLLPGTWTVRVIAKLPDWHVLEPETVEMEFGPQEVRTADFRVVPVVRGVRLITPRVGP